MRDLFQWTNQAIKHVGEAEQAVAHRPAPLPPIPYPTAPLLHCRSLVSDQWLTIHSCNAANNNMATFHVGQ